MTVRNLTLEQKRFLVGLLEMVCQKLELTPSEYDMAVGRYTTVGEWLASSDLPALGHSSIYSQGSIRLQTTVRPMGRAEFDVDLVCHLPRAHDMTPADVRNIVGQRLRDNSTYEDMLEPLNRGWRLNYANEFHMDITPAVDDPRHVNGGVLVPDRELRTWKESHPKGYADWFQNIAEREPFVMLEKGVLRADVEPLPDQERFKGTLRRTVQILKRHRDIYFDGKPSADNKDAPISIILTTLAAHAYRDCLPSGQYTNELDLLLDIVDMMPQYIQSQPGGEVWIQNPMNAKENFADKWNTHPARYVAFVEWHSAMHTALDTLAAAQGLDRVGGRLAQMLGDTVSKQALTEYTTRINSLRKSRTVSVAPSGLLGSVSTQRAAAGVTPNTFHGE